MGVYVGWLADAARSTGYRVVEIAGWRTRGHGPMRLVEVVVGHHTATPATAPGDYPSLNVVTNGRAGLPGPLANFGLGRDGTIYVIAAGLSYHAGASRWAGYLDLNDEGIGIEAESDGTGRWTPQQLDCYPKLVAALLRYMSRGVDRYAAHRDVAVPTGRKPDPTGIDSAWMRSTAQQYLTTGIPMEDGMAEDLVEPVRSWVANTHREVREPVHPSLVQPDINLSMVQFLQWGDKHHIDNGIKLDTVLAVVNTVLQAVTEGQLDPDTVLARVDTAVREATSDSINNVVLPALRGILVEVLGEDNEDQADAIVAAMGRALQAVTPAA